MTIYEIKRRTQEKQPYFFTRKTMRFFHQTLKMFSVTQYYDKGVIKYLIQATRYDFNGQNMGTTKRLFNPVTNDLETLK